MGVGGPLGGGGSSAAAVVVEERLAEVVGGGGGAASGGGRSRGLARAAAGACAGGRLARAAGARAGLRGRQALGRAQARAAVVWEEAWIRCAGPFLTVDKVGWAVFMGLSSLFSLFHDHWSSIFSFLLST